MEYIKILYASNLSIFFIIKIQEWSEKYRNENIFNDESVSYVNYYIKYYNNSYNEDDLEKLKNSINDQTNFEKILQEIHDAVKLIKKNTRSFIQEYYRNELDKYEENFEIYINYINKQKKIQIESLFFYKDIYEQFIKNNNTYGLNEKINEYIEDQQQHKQQQQLLKLKIVQFTKITEELTDHVGKLENEIKEKDEIIENLMYEEKEKNKLIDEINHKIEKRDITEKDTREKINLIEDNINALDNIIKEKEDENKKFNNENRNKS